MASPNAVVTEEVRKDYLGKVHRFLDSQLLESDINSGLSYHNATPDTHPQLSQANLIDSAEDVGERLQMVKTYVETIKAKVEAQEAEGILLENSDRIMNFQLNMAHVAGAMFADLDQLRQLVRSFTKETGLALSITSTFSSIINTESLVGIFLQQERNRSASQASSRKGSAQQSKQDDPAPQAPTSSPSHKPLVQQSDEGLYQNRVRKGSINREKSERDKAQDRDRGLCIVTKTANPNACHIWPFASNSTRGRVINLREVITSQQHLFSNELKVQLANLVAPGNEELATSDREWNMICFNTQIHRWWGEARFGLRWIGEKQEDIEQDDYCTFKVVWQWLPHKIHDNLDRRFMKQIPKDNQESRMLPQLDTEESFQALKDAIFKSLRGPSSGTIPGLKVLDGNGRPVETGRVITLRVQKKDYEKVKVVIEAQWILLQIAALSGAAESPEGLDTTFRCPPSLLPVWSSSEDTGLDEEPAGTSRPN